MVQVSLETPARGTAWNIHISSTPGLNDNNDNNMNNILNPVQVALESDYETPPWSQSAYSPLQDYGEITQRAINIYMLPKKPNGEMGGIGWWQTANGYTAMALHDIWSNNPQNYDVLCAAIRQCEANHKDLVNPFNDDMLWWGMLCLHMYTIKEDQWFLDQARGIWRHVRRSVCRKGEVFFQGRDMEGAVFWTTRPGEEQINAITTGLFAELSVRLALLAKSESRELDVSYKEYIETARCSLGWILRCRYRPQQGLVLDNIKLKQGKVNDWIFTYNTGVTLGVCALLFEATEEEEYMTLARHMAVRGMTRTGPKGWVEDNGVLTEKRAYGRGTHDPWKPNDAVGFKAVLIRQLCMLYRVVDRMRYWDQKTILLRTMIQNFININFRSQLEWNTNGKGQYGPWWAGPFECPTSHAQMAVLDVMAAVRLVNP